MSRRARQKRYTPRRVNPSAGLHALERRQPIAADAVRDIAITARTAFERLRRGHGDGEDLYGLGFAANVSLLFAEAGFGPECEPEIFAAQEALLRAHERLRTHGRPGLDGPGITEIRALLEIYEQQLEAALVGDIVAVLREINRRVEAGAVVQRAGDILPQARP